jgi:hypothetical protein
MNLVKILILIGIAGFVVHLWKNHEAQKLLTSELSPSGFIRVAMPDNAPNNSVIILAPVNCPSDAAQRADALAARLSNLGIPIVRSSSFSANIENPTDEQNTALRRAVSVLEGEIPAVFLNGMGKSNPTIDEVTAEYERTRP